MCEKGCLYITQTQKIIIIIIYISIYLYIKSKPLKLSQFSTSVQYLNKLSFYLNKIIFI